MSGLAECVNLSIHSLRNVVSAAIDCNMNTKRRIVLAEKIRSTICFTIAWLIIRILPYRYLELKRCGRIWAVTLEQDPDYNYLTEDHKNATHYCFRFYLHNGLAVIWIQNLFEFFL
jgi:hypothetical protein